MPYADVACIGTLQSVYGFGRKEQAHEASVEVKPKEEMMVVEEQAASPAKETKLVRQEEAVAATKARKAAQQHSCPNDES